MTTFKIGDEVRLLQRQRRRGTRVPIEGWSGVVIKVAKKYATAEIEQTWTDSDGAEHRSKGEFSFDMETGIVRADTEGLYVQTPEQIDREARRKEAIHVLGLAGIEFRLGHAHFFTTEQIEALAEVVKTWED